MAKEFISAEVAVQQTICWIQEVVIGCNFCPFASKALLKNTIRYQVLEDVDLEQSLNHLTSAFIQLDENKNIETTLLIFLNDFKSWTAYLQLVEYAETLLFDLGYEGIYQVASFHPEYCFAGSKENDASNYTNRSIFPMLHILREESITETLQNFSNPEKIPKNNVAFAEKKGLLYMQMLRAGCMK